MQKIIQHQGQPLAYDIHVHPTGKPLLLLHGFGETPAVFAQVLPVLKDHHTVVLPYLPGTGPSAALAGGASMEAMGAAVAAIVLAENLEPVVVAGHSMGGYVAMAMAEADRQLLRGLGLINSSAAADDEEKKVVRRKAIAFMQEKGGALFFQETGGNLFGKAFKQQHPQAIAQYVSAGSAVPTNSLIQYYEGMMQRPDRRHLLNLPLPFLFIMGEEDNAVPLKIALEQSVIPQNAYIQLLEKTGHVSLLESPDRTTQALLAFMHLC